MRRLAAVAAGLAFGIAFVAMLATMAVAASGALARRAGDWTMPVKVAGGTSLDVNVPGLVRLATSPLGRRLLHGRTIDTGHGPLEFTRDGGALVVRCAPCRVDDPRVAARPLTLPAVVLRMAARRDAGGNTLDGTLAHDALVVHFVAHLRSSDVRVTWSTADAPAGEFVRLFAAAIPEAAHVQVEGTLAAHGELSLPSLRGGFSLRPRAVSVSGLATELLQFGPLAFNCKARDGRRRTLQTGDETPAWRSLDQLGALPSAVVAALDPAFLQRPAAAVDDADAPSNDHKTADALARLLSGLSTGAAPAPTLTHRLAEHLYGDGPATTLAARVRIALYALEMERTLSRERIVALYLNTAPWEPGVCGATAAARAHFRKRPERLTLVESERLAAWLVRPRHGRTTVLSSACGAAPAPRAGCQVPAHTDAPGGR